MSLVAFRGCDDAMRGLRNAANAAVGPYGLAGSGIAYVTEAVVPQGMAAAPDSAARAAAAPGAIRPRAEADSGGAARPGGAAPAHSGTNNHEVGVDEPDLVKTDGHRIVLVADGVLHVIDASTRSVVGRLDIAAAGNGYRHAVTNLLLDGDHALLLVDGPAFA